MHTTTTGTLTLTSPSFGGKMGGTLPRHERVPPHFWAGAAEPGRDTHRTLENKEKQAHLLLETDTQSRSPSGVQLERPSRGELLMVS